MEIIEVVKSYLEALRRGSYEDIVRLFADDAVVVSPLYGRVRARDFYRELLEDTGRSEITLLNLFVCVDKSSVAAAHFRYTWTLRDGSSTSFECVDIFELAEDGRIEKLTIIYDAHKARQMLSEMKAGSVHCGDARLPN